MVHPDSHRVSRVPWYLGTRSRKNVSFRVQGYHFLWRTFPGPSAKKRFGNFPACARPGPATPPPVSGRRFRLFPFRSPLLGESRRFLFLGVLRCFSSPRSLQRPMNSAVDNTVLPCWVLPFGNLRIKACWRLPEAYRNQLRPSSPPGAKVSPVCP